MHRLGMFRLPARVAAGLFVCGSVLTGLALPAPGQSPGAKPARSGREIYQAACASCHGGNGRGAPRTTVGFDTPLPDFTDCNFATRERVADWTAIVHEGGPARGFSRLMPAFGEALTGEELERVVDYLKTFCSDNDWPRGELNLPRLLVTEKAYPEDEAVFSFAASTEGLGSVSNQIIYEKRLGARNQVELSIPFGWQEAELPTMSPIARYHWIGGLGDISIGAKRALFHNGRSGTIFSVTGEFVLPTGDSAKGFGKGTPVFETFASFGQILPSQFFCQAQAGVELPKNTELAEREGFWRFSLGRTFSRGISGRSWSPMVEMLAARELISGEKVQWDAVPQMQVSLSRRQHILASFGVRLPLTESGPRAAQFLCYILWDWFDGGFFEGWR